MKITPKNVKKFQMGGQMAPENAAPEAPEAAQEQTTQDPLVQLAQMAAQALQSQDCNMAMQVCQAFIEIAQQAAAPQEAPGEPVFAKGGKLLRRMQK